MRSVGVTVDSANKQLVSPWAAACLFGVSVFPACSPPSSGVDTLSYVMPGIYGHEILRSVGNFVDMLVSPGIWLDVHDLSHRHAKSRPTNHVIHVRT